MTRKMEEVYPQRRPDRRLVPNLPDRGQSRRGTDARYQGKVEVVLYDPEDKKNAIQCASLDLSCSGMLVAWPEQAALPAVGDRFIASFYLPPGIMPEGYESRVRVDASVVRAAMGEASPLVALNFSRNIEDYLRNRRWRGLAVTSVGCLLASLLAVMYLRQESFFYFVFDIPVFLYGIIASVYLISRFAFALFYRNTPVDQSFTPGVSIIIPCFNEEDWIEKTIQCSLDQNYPQDKLEVILVDDGSTDSSMEKVNDLAERIRREITGDRLGIIRQPRNMGKRHAMAAGALRARHDLLIFVDSDSFLDPNAVREIVQPFKEPEMGAVAGRTEVQNKWTNAITKMQAVRYYVAFRFFKASEAVFDAVTCLSGPLACYRKNLVLKYLDAWLNQTFMGHAATFGDDRSLTNYILSEARTGYQDSAVCSTIVPSSMKTFIRQQMRWKRSWLRETMRAASFMWRKEPFMAISFYIGFVLPVLAPVVVVRTMLVVPLMYGIFPYTYLIGVFVMSTLMSAAYLFFKRSNLWFYGITFCFFYFGVLLWQLPVALCTFWKSEWGTRSTFADVARPVEASEEPEAAFMPEPAAGAVAERVVPFPDSPGPAPAPTLAKITPMPDSNLPVSKRAKAAPGAATPAPVAAPHRMAIIMRLLSGENIETLSGQYGLDPKVVAGWRDAFLSAGEREVEKMERLENMDLREIVLEQDARIDFLSEKIALLESELATRGGRS